MIKSEADVDCFFAGHPSKFLAFICQQNSFIQMHQHKHHTVKHPILF